MDLITRLGDPTFARTVRPVNCGGLSGSRIPSGIIGGKRLETVSERVSPFLLGGKISRAATWGDSRVASWDLLSSLT